MTFDDVLRQAMTLSVHERKELAKQLINTLDDTMPADMMLFADDTASSSDNWGMKLLDLLDSIPSDELMLIYPEIDDPVQWVKQIRDDQHRQRLNKMDEDE